MTFEDCLTGEQLRRLKQIKRAAVQTEVVDPVARFLRPVEGAVRVTPEQMRAFAGTADEPQGRGWHKARSQERVTR